MRKEKKTEPQKRKEKRGKKMQTVTEASSSTPLSTY